MIGYVVGCIAVLTVGAVLAKDPAQTVAPSLSAITPAGCTDSQRGRTHVLRFCGDKHYWIKVATVWPTTSLLAGGGGGGGPGTVTPPSINLNR
jgi:hypothetical protein